MHTHRVNVAVADAEDYVEVSGGEDCIWCKSSADERARIQFVSPSSIDMAEA